jgi:hypothetical protein
MKNVLKITVFAIMTVFMVNCSTNEDEVGSTSAGWKLGSTNYNQGFMIKMDAGVFVQYVAWDKIPTADEANNNSNSNVTLNSFGFLFKSTPAAGTYDIVFKSDPSLLTSTEVMISSASKTENKNYVAFVATTVKATVTVSGGKVTITVPEIQVSQEGNVNVTTTLSGTLKEI